MSTPLPVGGSFRVLDANRGLNNIVDDKTYREMLDEVCDIVLENMKDHCGPYATFAIIDDPMTDPDKPFFSKDGMDITDSIRFINPIQYAIRRLLSYCSKNSDKIAGDGTTSAMIITISALRYINNFLKEEKDQGRRYSYKELYDVYRDFKDQFVNSDGGLITIDKLHDYVFKTVTQLTDREIDIPTDILIRKAVIYGVAYNQAYISSHGDEDLAIVVAKMFTTIPEESWDHVFFSRSIFEKDDYRYKLIVSDSQFEMPCRIMNKDMLNAKLGHKLSYKNAKLVPLMHPIYAANKKYFDALMDLMEQCIRDKEELLIIHTENLDNMTSQAINSKLEYLKDEGVYNTTVAIVRHEPLQARLNLVTVLNLVCGKMPTDANEMFNIIEGVSVEFDQLTLKLNGLYENPDNSLIHPLVDDPEFTQFNSVLDFIEETMENTKASGATYTRADDIMNFHELYYKMKYTKTAVIHIGGNTHDSVTSVAIVKDAIMAARASLQRGFELGGMAGILQKFHTMDCSADSARNQKIMLMFMNAFTAGVDILHDYLSENASDINFSSMILNSGTWTDNSIDTLSSVEMYNLINRRYVSAFYFIKYVINDLVVISDNPKCFDKSKGFHNLIQEHPDVSVIQPVDINNTIITRFGELFLKMVTSSKVIGPDGVVGSRIIEKDKDK